MAVIASLDAETRTFSASTFAVNPPDPSGYVPQMFVMCMNDRGTDVAPDPLYQDSYSQFCYEWPMMPGETPWIV